MDEDRPDIYEFLGTYSNDEARRLLEAFVADDIAYTVSVNKSGLRDLPVPEAAFGGTFGTGVGIAIGVHFDDAPKARVIMRRVLKILP